METRYRNRPAEWVVAIAGGVAILIGLSGFSVGEPIQAAVFLLLGIAFVSRAFRQSDVIVSTAEVRARSILRTRRLPLSCLQSAEVVIGQPGLGPYRREFLVFHKKDGADITFRDFNGSLRRGDRSLVSAAAADINSRIAGA